MNVKKQYIKGMKAGIPVVFGFIPVGIAYGVMARQAGFTAAEACAMSMTVFAGASQMMSVGMCAGGASVISVVFAVMILNLRHLIMSVCVMNRMKGGGVGTRLLAAFGVTDESFAIFTTQNEANSTPAYFLGLITVTYASWNVGSLIGAAAADLLPAVITASLGIALYALFIGLLVPKLNHNRNLGVLVIFTAVCSSVLNRFMTSSRALIVSALACAFIGVFFVDLEEKENGRE